STRPGPLYPVYPDEIYCALKPDLALPAEGAPLVFATQLAHDLVLHIEAASDPKSAAGGAQPAGFDLPMTADATEGGLIPAEAHTMLPGGNLTGVVRGKWGFDDWEGPRFRLASSEPGKWTLTP